MTKMFQLKFKKFLRDFIERYVIKIINAHIYVIEFSKKKFVAYLYFFITNFRNEFDENNIDDVVHAIIFFKKIFKFDAKRKIFYKLIVEQIIHKNCKKIEKVFCQNFENKCIK